MRPGPTPTFGKRGVPRAPVPGRPAAVEPHAAFFAAIRAEGAAPAGMGETPGAVETPAIVVPRSWRAGLLAGLVVACALAGLEATRNIAEMHHLSAMTGGRVDIRVVAPALILLAVAGGGRSAATSLLLAHSALARLGRTEPWAYALGGAAAAAGIAALFAAVGVPVRHDLAVDAAAGALGGFFYRIFAGTRAA